MENENNIKYCAVWSILMDLFESKELKKYELEKINRICAEKYKCKPIPIG